MVAVAVVAMLTTQGACELDGMLLQRLSKIADPKKLELAEESCDQSRAEQNRTDQRHFVEFPHSSLPRALKKRSCKRAEGLQETAKG